MPIQHTIFSTNAVSPVAIAASSEQGTLGFLDPAFTRPVRPAPRRGSREYQVMERLRRRIRDSADQMVIPQQKEALAIARRLSDALYSRAKAAPVTTISHEPAHPNDPGTILVGALRRLSNAVFAPSPLDDRPDISGLRQVLLELDAFLDGPRVADARHMPLEALQTLIGRLISYYG